MNICLRDREHLLAGFDVHGYAHVYDVEGIGPRILGVVVAVSGTAGAMTEHLEFYPEQLLDEVGEQAARELVSAPDFVFPASDFDFAWAWIDSANLQRWIDWANEHADRSVQIVDL